MKPDWKDAPDFANWLAMDGNGEWWWFENKPWWDPWSDVWMLAAHGGQYEEAAQSEIDGEGSLTMRPFP